MILRRLTEMMEFCEDPSIRAENVRGFLTGKGVDPSEIEIRPVRGEKGGTLFVKIRLRAPKPGREGERVPPLGIIGRLGGIGARPHRLGLVSDADGALAALAAALELAAARRRGDALACDVLVATHLCPDAPVIPHDPVPFMGAPVSMELMNRYEVDRDMAAVLSIDATKGNRVFNQRGFAITPTVKQGWILRVSEDLLDIMQHVTGAPPAVLPITTQDITPYGNGVYHLNSILQPATATPAPVVGVALTAAVAVPGCASGANQPEDIARAAGFAVETAAAWSRGECRFYDPEEFSRLIQLYGSLEHLQTRGPSSLP
jgi:hypothetical protein